MTSYGAAFIYELQKAVTKHYKIATFTIHPSKTLLSQYIFAPIYRPILPIFCFYKNNDFLFNQVHTLKLNYGSFGICILLAVFKTAI